QPRTAAESLGADADEQSIGGESFDAVTVAKPLLRNGDDGLSLVIGRNDDLRSLRRSQRDGIACKIAVLPRNGRIREAGRRLAHKGARRADVVRPELMLPRCGDDMCFLFPAVCTKARLLPRFQAGGRPR